MHTCDFTTLITMTHDFLHVETIDSDQVGAPVFHLHWEMQPHTATYLAARGAHRVGVGCLSENGRFSQAEGHGRGVIRKRRKRIIFRAVVLSWEAIENFFFNKGDNII